MRLKNKTAIVTGAGGAIGRAVSLKLAGEGSRIALFESNKESSYRLSRELESCGNEPVLCHVDVSDYDSVVPAVERVFERFGTIDILVNCAGGSARGKMTEFHNQKIEVIREMLGVNLFGALHCIHAVIPYMLKAESGSIVNVTSIVALNGKRQCAEYGAAKGGIIAATKSLAIELGKHNININCVCPGLVSRTRPENEDELARRFSYVNRICTQGDIAHAVLFMLLPESDFITGHNLVVDGGRSLGLKGDA